MISVYRALSVYSPARSPQSLSSSSSGLSSSSVFRDRRSHQAVAAATSSIAVGVPASGGSSRREAWFRPHPAPSHSEHELSPIAFHKAVSASSPIARSLVRRVTGRNDNSGQGGHYDHMPRYATVGAREHKTRLGGYLQQVRQGRTLVITERGKPVAELKPLHRAGTEDAELERLQALGAVTRLENRPLAPFRLVRSRGSSVSDAILEDRDDRV